MKKGEVQVTKQNFLGCRSKPRYKQLVLCSFSQYILLNHVCTGWESYPSTITNSDYTTAADTNTILIKYILIKLSQLINQSIMNVVAPYKTWVWRVCRHGSRNNNDSWSQCDSRDILTRIRGKWHVICSHRGRRMKRKRHFAASNEVTWGHRQGRAGSVMWRRCKHKRQLLWQQERSVRCL